MIRAILVLALGLLASTPVLAKDDGGFGAGFTNKPPSALAETPNSAIAQSVPSAEDLQNILPAAGTEEGADQVSPVTPSFVQSVDSIAPETPVNIDTPKP